MARGTVRKRLVGDGTDKRKNIRYDVVYRVNGKQAWKTFRRREDADAHLEEVCSDIRDGSYRKLKEATFAEYADGWKDRHFVLKRANGDGKLKASTIRGYRTILDCYLIPYFGKKPLRAIDAELISSFEAHLMKSVSNKTIHNALTLFGRVLEQARRDAYLRVSPMIDVKKPTFECRKGRALQPDEVQKLIVQCDGELRVIAGLGLRAGLRRSEILGLHWTSNRETPRSFVDFDADKIRIRSVVQFLSREHGQVSEGVDAFEFVPPKSKAGVRDIPLSAALKLELLKLRLASHDKEGLIFQTRSGCPYNPSNVYKRQFQPAVQAADIGRVTMHHLRHTYGSVLRDQGVDIYEIMKWMGHSSIDVTIDTYGHSVRDHGKEAVQKMDAFFATSGGSIAVTATAVH